MVICPCDKLGNIEMLVELCELISSAFPCQAVKDKHGCFFLYCEIKCLNPNIFSHNILLMERKNICPAVDAGVPQYKKKSSYFGEILL